MVGLKAIRESRMLECKRFTQAEAAGVAGVSVPKYRKLEENPQDITMAQAKALADYLGCSIEDVFVQSDAN